MAGPGLRESDKYFVLWGDAECAEALRMKLGTLRNMGKKGPPKLKLGGHVFYRPEAVAEWLKKHESPSK